MDFTKNKKSNCKKDIVNKNKKLRMFYLDLFRAICLQFCTFLLLLFKLFLVFNFCSLFAMGLLCNCNCDYSPNCTVNISRAPKPDCVHMSADVRGCMCGLCRLLRRCINGTFGFSCHLCVYACVCWQSVCFCACADLNHCSLYMLKKNRLGGAVIFS